MNSMSVSTTSHQWRTCLSLVTIKEFSTVINCLFHVFSRIGNVPIPTGYGPRYARRNVVVDAGRSLVCSLEIAQKFLENSVEKSCCGGVTKVQK